MAESKTEKPVPNVEDFLSQIADENVRQDCRKIAEMMQKATGDEAQMGASNIIGFGKRKVKYASGKEMDWFLTAFSPRKANITLYLSTGEAWNDELLAKLGKHKVGMGCLFIKKLSDVDEDVLRKLIDESVQRAEK